MNRSIIHTTMKRILAIIGIVTILAMGLVGALSVVPHSHGKDFNHSQHENCPIHQFSHVGFSAITALFAHLIFFFLRAYIHGFERVTSTFFTINYSYLRAPPGLL